jgi:predicted nucleic acid-binding protein
LPALIDKIVIDTSPLIVLFKSQLAYLLPQLFAEIIVPKAVWDEIVEAGKTDAASIQLPNVSWAKKVNLSRVSPVIVAWELDIGESEVLSFGLENVGYRTVIDDAAARRVAKALNIPFMGTLGILTLAKKKHLISTISEPIQVLQEAGLWLAEDLINFLKEQAGE